jgi:O-acetyl-ADP-ribose deacetylase (regulator of RNase III)
MTMRLHLIDTDAGVVAALRDAFRSFPEVEIALGNILTVARNTVVSPANSYGFMDCGIDRAYLDFFGPAIQARVQEALAQRPEGYLPVGASLVIRTGHVRIPYLVLAPTMLAPEAVTRDNCYRAMRAVLRVANFHPEIGRVLFSPGLGTGVGMVHPGEAAEEMAQAYKDWKGNAGPGAATDRPRDS